MIEVIANMPNHLEAVTALLLYSGLLAPAMLACIFVRIRQHLAQMRARAQVGS
jgi:hypothetical protein